MRALEVKNISKLYKLGQIGTGTLSHDLNRWLASLLGKEDPFKIIGEENDRIGWLLYFWYTKQHYDLKKLHQKIKFNLGFDVM